MLQKQETHLPALPAVGGYIIQDGNGFLEVYPTPEDADRRHGQPCA